ncbi:unnamed protein product [Cyprideis torosa]|uniref:Elongation of very long chain fatty acids protein n=1 Tax=Cyprideis torosa TaxID=163714 RepID=A0A7R8ZJU7_9CRUS|nr:unnamed protein product [Cyprideis torosa]CAG0887979.1 unnamed protein product [Cyprideis torosa]
MEGNESMFYDPDVGFLSEEEYNFTQALRHNFYRPPRQTQCWVFFPNRVEDYFKSGVFSQSIFFRRYWWTGFPICAVYLLLIFAAQRYMRDRKPYDLKGSLIAWNWGIAIFSMIAAFRGITFLAGEILTGQFDEAVCYVSHGDEVCQGIAIWIILFGWSKVLELGDTAFIVLRKKPLIVLHWYHHVTVLLYVWYTAGQGPAVGVFFAVLNVTVHAFMYTYYAFRAMGYRIPKGVSMSLTLMQISQMVVGLSLNYYAYYLKKTTFKDCHVDPLGFSVCMLMYGSYAVLFMWFFYNAYITPKSNRDSKNSKQGDARNAIFEFVDSYNENMAGEDKTSLKLQGMEFSVEEGAKLAIWFDVSGTVTEIIPLNRDEVLAQIPSDEPGRGAKELEDSFIEFLQRSRFDDERRPRQRKRKVNVAPGASVSVDDLRGRASPEASVSAAAADLEEEEDFPLIPSGSTGRKMTAPRRRTARRDEESEDSDLDLETDSDECAEAPVPRPSPVRGHSCPVDSYVWVIYDKKKYPGEILKWKSSEAEVRTMIPCGQSHWRWPAGPREEDAETALYDKSVIQPLNGTLTVFNSRGGLNLLGILGCALVISGCVLLILLSSVYEVVDSFYAFTDRLETPVVMIFLVTVTALILFLLFYGQSHWGDSSPLVFVGICSLIGTLSVIACKGIGRAIQDAMEGDFRVFSASVFWLCVIVVVFCVAFQTTFLRRALDHFPPSIIIPLYYTLFVFCVILAGNVVLREWELLPSGNVIGIVCALFIIFVGILILATFKDSRTQEAIMLFLRRLRGEAVGEDPAPAPASADRSTESRRPHRTGYRTAGTELDRSKERKPKKISYDLSDSPNPYSKPVQRVPPKVNSGTHRRCPEGFLIPKLPRSPVAGGLQSETPETPVVSHSSEEETSFSARQRELSTTLKEVLGRGMYQQPLRDEAGQEAEGKIAKRKIGKKVHKINLDHEANSTLEFSTHLSTSSWMISVPTLTSGVIGEFPLPLPPAPHRPRSSAGAERENRPSGDVLPQDFSDSYWKPAQRPPRPCRQRSAAPFVDVSSVGSSGDVLEGPLSQSSSLQELGRPRSRSPLSPLRKKSKDVKKKQTHGSFRDKFSGDLRK